MNLLWNACLIDWSEKLDPKQIEKEGTLWKVWKWETEPGLENAESLSSLYEWEEIKFY